MDVIDRLLEEEENKAIALKRAIQEGIDSGIADDFDPTAHLKQLKSAKANGYLLPDQFSVGGLTDKLILL